MDWRDWPETKRMLVISYLEAKVKDEIRDTALVAVFRAAIEKLKQ